MEGNLSINDFTSSSSYSYEYDLSDAFKYPIQIEIFISIFVWCVSLFTVVGNILVIASYARDAQLRAKVASLFLLNLASADLLVGVNSLTLNNLWRYYGNWPFGEPLCKIFVTLDYTATLQSTFAILLISLDRYLVVTMHINYNTFMTRRKAVLYILLTWFVAILFYGVPILSYDLWKGGSGINYSVSCDVAVVNILSFHIVMLIFAFTIPGVFLVYFNLVVFLDIRRRSRGLVSSNRIVPLALPLQELNGDVRSIAPPVIIIQRVRDRQSKRFTLKRDKRTAIRLAAMVIIYVICVLPYYITQLIYAASKTEYDISWAVWNAVYYLMWLNSALNPCIYAIAFPRIRQNFYELLFFWKQL